jgi:hypothetical protein|tara:strand:- start:980 stop:1504 length:525 start_codon:yes stop_codon:yes gene_type:complete
VPGLFTDYPHALGAEPHKPRVQGAFDQVGLSWKKILLITISVLALLCGIAAITLPTILRNAGLHPEYTGEPVELGSGKRALIITTSHGVLAEHGMIEGQSSGVMASEFTHPYYNFTDAGIAADLASIKDGEIPIDPQTLNYAIRTPEDERFMDDSVLQAKVNDSIPIDDIDFAH